MSGNKLQFVIMNERVTPGMRVRRRDTDRWQNCRSRDVKMLNATEFGDLETQSQSKLSSIHPNQNEHRQLFGLVSDTEVISFYNAHQPGERHNTHTNTNASVDLALAP